MPLYRLFSEKDLAMAHPAVEAVFKQGKRFAGMEVSVLSGEGPPICCELSADPLASPENHIIGVLLFFTPLESSAHQNSQTQETLFDHLPKGSFTTDNQWRITAFNKAAEKITGFSQEEALGRHCWDIFRSDMCHNHCPMRMALDRKQPEMDRQLVAVNRHGVRQTLSVNVSLLKNANGDIVGAVETFHSSGILSTPFNVPGRLLGLVGNSPVMRSLFEVLSDLALSRANVLICGESGTGKDLAARTLHGMSKNGKAPFVAVNCSALPETLIETELFGQEKGAFTGASQGRAGRFELAGQGTLLLDEIGELKPDLQVKLLRVIEQRSFERVGGSNSIPFAARLISATHQDLPSAIREKRFREDLYYRLRTVTITVPPLRERREDIPLLVDYFIKKFNARTGKQVRSLDPKVMRRFAAYPWPGNVRELERFVEHAFVFVKGPVIFQHHLPEFESSETPSIEIVQPHAGIGEQRRKEDVLEALKQVGGRKKAAAGLLGISRTSMWRRMKAMGLE